MAVAKPEIDNVLYAFLLQVETIRRAEAIVGEELVDIEYRVFNGPTMLSAESVVETMNRLSEAEMVSTLEYGVHVLFISLCVYFFSSFVCIFSNGNLSSILCF